MTHLEAHPGRYRLIHIKGMTKPVRFFGDGGPQRWIELFTFMTDAGAGVLDLVRILSHTACSAGRRSVTRTT